jgi:hypothetical protein
MKKNQMKSIVMLLVSMFVLNVLTVETADAQFSIGIKVAGNAANYNQLTKKDFGMEAGLFMRLGNGFFFQPEANYVFKRSTPIATTGEFSTDDLIKQHYISVPLLLGYHFINNENFKFRLTLGPRFDFKIADNQGNNEWQTNTVQWGGQAGVGIDFWRFALDFSYCIAADNFRNMIEGTNQTKMANMFILSLGFKFLK